MLIRLVVECYSCPFHTLLCRDVQVFSIQVVRFFDDIEDAGACDDAAHALEAVVPSEEFILVSIGVNAVMSEVASFVETKEASRGTIGDAICFDMAGLCDPFSLGSRRIVREADVADDAPLAGCDAKDGEVSIAMDEVSHVLRRIDDKPVADCRFPLCEGLGSGGECRDGRGGQKKADQR